MFAPRFSQSERVVTVSPAVTRRQWQSRPAELLQSPLQTSDSAVTTCEADIRVKQGQGEDPQERRSAVIW